MVAENNLRKFRETARRSKLVSLGAGLMRQDPKVLPFPNRKQTVIEMVSIGDRDGDEAA